MALWGYESREKNHKSNLGRLDERRVENPKKKIQESQDTGRRAFLAGIFDCVFDLRRVFIQGNKFIGIDILNCNNYYILKKLFFITIDFDTKPKKFELDNLPKNVTPLGFPRMVKIKCDLNIFFFHR